MDDLLAQSRFECEYWRGRCEVLERVLLAHKLIVRPEPLNIFGFEKKEAD